MGDLFDRNVHPLYAVMAFVCAAIVLILLLNHLGNNRKERKNELLSFFGFIIFYCIQDGVWGLLASGIINSDTGLMVASAVFHFSSALAPFIWTLFFCGSLRELIRKPKIWRSIAAVLMLAQLGMIIANFSSHFMFYVDETGNYQTTDARAILFYVQFFVYLLVAAVASFGILHTKLQTRRSSFRTFLWISLTPVFFDVFQLIYPDAPANSVGLCIACVLVQIFLTKTVETQVRELKAEAELQKSKQKEILSAGVIYTLSNEYGPLYLTDLQTGSLQVFRKSDMERALPVQQLALETPEYIDFIREYAGRYVIENDREAFLAWTEPKHLDSIINTENISEFNYLRNMNGTLNYYQFCCGRVAGESYENLMVFGFRNVDAIVKKDIETKKALEQALSVANVASEAKTKFLFNMSHDIRTPMNAILGFTDLTRKHLDDPSCASEYLAKLDDAGHQLLDLINEVLDMSRIESGKLSLNEEPMNLTAASNTTIEICTEAGRQRGVTVELHRGAAGDLWVYCDETRINQVAMNIISNAIKYTNPGGRVDIWVNILGFNADNTVSLELVVKDTGIGMSKEFLEKIYEPFERSQSSTVSGIQGTGLGMSIVKQLIDLMHGTISISSELGAGTTVIAKFTFRLAQAETFDTAEETSGDKVRSLEGMHILLVEDNEMNREIACEILEEKDVTVDTAEDGDIAVEKMQNAAEGQYDLVLMDIQMPRMNGYDAARAIRKLSNPYAANIPIIAMTANAFDEDKRNALDAGMNGHLAKPIDVQKLFVTLSEVMK